MRERGNETRQEDDATPDRDKAKAAIKRWLDEAVGLDEAKKANYQAAAEKVIGAMGPAALKRWNENVQSITFYPDTESIKRFLRRKQPHLVNVSGIRGLCIRDRSHPYLCHLHLNGGDDTGDASPLKTSNLYAHEFAHAIDWGRQDFGPLSMNRAWREISPAEKRQVHRWLDIPDQDPGDDFAYFAIAAWNYPEDARRHYPECWAFWSNRGLLS